MIPHETNAWSELEKARACFEQRAWEDAFQSFARADGATPLGCDDLELFAWSAALTGRDKELLETLERLHHTLVDEGQCLRAARAAFWIAFRLFALRSPGHANGWLVRAARIVERESEDSVEQGYLLLPIAERHLGAGENDVAHDVAARAAAIGERFEEADLIAFARQQQGRALMRQGHVDPGLALLDEAMVAVTSGELSPIVNGIVYCSVIASCQQVYALDRAREWTKALAEWCQEQPQLVTFTGTCLIHRADVMQLHGAWEEAIGESFRACERLSKEVDPEALGDAHYQQGEIHRLRGELTQAEDAYRSASQVGREPQPGLALLRLQQGRMEEAIGAIRRVLDTTPATWRRAGLLPACVEILLAAGDLEGARGACLELTELAETFDTKILRAMASHARGAVLLADGDAGAAVTPLRDAFHVWQSVGAPYLAARIRVLIGRACSALGDEDGAALELSAAREVFEQLGAAPDIAKLHAERQDSGRASDHGLTARELQVLRMVASGKTNKAIAAELCLSERTVDRHVSNIFVKTDVSTRAAATAFAYEHDLV
jgi:ATP/maltotriose-dependent transcriptional regulator MalT